MVVGGVALAVIVNSSQNLLPAVRVAATERAARATATAQVVSAQKSTTPTRASPTGAAATPAPEATALPIVARLTAAPAVQQPTQPDSGATPAPDEGRPSDAEPTIPIPSAAVPDPNKQQVAGNAWYRVPGMTPNALVSFYRSLLPKNGWRIDIKYADFEGKTPGAGNTRFIPVCKKPAVWYEVLVGDDVGDTRLNVLKLPDDDPC